MHGSIQLFPKEYKAIFQFLLTSPMKVAQYTCAEMSQNWKHFALKIPYYTHFTSPIRRYADVMVHRVLTSVLQGSDIDYSTSDIQAIAENCNSKNSASKTAQMECDKVFLFHKHPMEYEAIVSGVGAKSFSLFIEELDIEQRLFLSDMKLKGAFNEKTKVLTIDDKQIFFLNRVKVRLSVDLDIAPIQLKYDLI